MKFARETLTDAILDEAHPLLVSHWKEIAHYPDIVLNPDRDFYLKAEHMKMARLFTIRDDEGSLCGYAVFFVKNNPHYKDSIQASQDILFLSKDLRGGLRGFKFIKWCDEQLKAEGVQVVYQHVKTAHNFGAMLERIGYEQIDLIYGRRLN